MGGLDLVLAGSLLGEPAGLPGYVRINADRGHWSLTLRFGRMTRWITPEAWRSYLDRVPMEIQGMEQRVSFVEHRVNDMARAVRNDPDVESTLVGIGEEYMRRKLGL
jgi:hypothetical protein